MAKEGRPVTDETALAHKPKLIDVRWEEEPGTTRKRAVWCERINTQADVLKAIEEVAALIKPRTEKSYWRAEDHHKADQEGRRLNLLRGIYRGVATAPQNYLMSRVLYYGVEAVGGLEANKLNRLADRAKALWPEPPREEKVDGKRG